MKLFLHTFLLAALLCTGCGKDAPNKPTGGEEPAPEGANEAQSTEAEKPASEEAEEAKAEEAVPEAPKGPHGLKAESNNPALVAALGSAAKCDLNGGSVLYRCGGALKHLVKAFDKAKDIPTAVNFLDDPDPVARWAGAYLLKTSLALQTANGRSHTDQVLNASARENNKAVGELLGEILLHLDFENDSVATRVQGMASGHKLPSFRSALYSNLKAQNNDKYIPFMIEQYGKEKDKGVRLSIVKGLGGNTGGQTEAACSFSASLLNDKDLSIASAATYNITWNREKCKAHYDAFLDSYEQWSKNDKLGHPYPLNAVYFPRNKSVTDAQKARYLTITKALASNSKLSGMTRGTFLESVVKTEPNGKAYAKQFLSDADKMLKSRATRLAK